MYSSVFLQTIKQENRDVDSSELHIYNVSMADAGYYECVASDGECTNNNGLGKGEWTYVTVSRRAWLQVVGNLSAFIDCQITS